MVAGSAVAGDWEIHPRVTLGEIYSDNIALDPDNLAQDDYVTQLSPGIKLSREGSRLRTDLNYQLQSFFYARAPKRNDVFHQLDAEGTAELLEELLFLDASLKFDQSVINPEGKVSQSNLSRTGNRTDVATLMLSPVLRKRFGDILDFETRYTFDRVDYRAANLHDNDTTRVEVKLDGGPRFRQLGWGMRFSSEHQNFTRAADADFEKADIVLRYPRDRRFVLVATAGYENDKYQRSPSGTVPNGSLWSLGFDWAPSSVNRLSASVGHRFFGTTYEASLTHEASHGDLSLGYSEETVTSNRFIIDRTNFISPEPNAPFVVPINESAPGITPEVFLRKRGDLKFHYRFRRSELRLSLFRERREFQRTGRTEQVLRTDVGWDWHLGPRTDLDLTASRQNRDFQITKNDVIFRAGAALVRRMSPRVEGRVRYQYTDRSSDVASTAYTENRISLEVTATF